MGYFRGVYCEIKLIEFCKYFDCIDIVSKIFCYKFDENLVFVCVVDVNISEVVFVSIKIEKEENGKIVFNVDKFFLSEVLYKVLFWVNLKDKDVSKCFKFGKLDDKKLCIIM